MYRGRGQIASSQEDTALDAKIHITFFMGFKKYFSSLLIYMYMLFNFRYGLSK